MWLAGTFLFALIIANVLAASKLIVIDLGFHQLILAVGIIAYPITFLVTDIICELYGQKRATELVWVGFFVSMLLLVFVEIGRAIPALSSEQQNIYTHYFSSSARAVFASMLAYLVAQFLDVRLFHFWKRVTAGKHLWLRNNGSTIGSQLVDTVVVSLVLFWGTSPPHMNGGVMGFAEIAPIIRDGFLFKGVVALFDTPLLYLAVALLRPLVCLTPTSEAPLS